MPRFIKTKPSFLESGLPCASLSAECQRDNNSLRPPQNRLHIWWARRAPTICRAAILAALLPHDLQIPESLLPASVPEPTESELESIPSRFRDFLSFYLELLNFPPTQLTIEHQSFLRALDITGDAARAYRRIAAAETAGNGTKIDLGQTWGYRHPRAFNLTPEGALVEFLLGQIRRTLSLSASEPVVVADTMAGGGSIPLEAIRYGFKVYANDLNPVAALLQKATLEYPARFSNRLLPHLSQLVAEIGEKIRQRLAPFFPTEPAEAWWPALEEVAKRKFRSASIQSVEPGLGQPIKRNTFLWMRLLPCAKCGLRIPLSTNFMLSRKGPSAAHLAIFPEVPPLGGGVDCSFRIVSSEEWASCRWPRFSDGDVFEPTTTVTYRDGTAICPRCGNVVDGESVKSLAKSMTGGLRSQLYPVSCRVPIKVTYRSGDVKCRYLWRFRTPSTVDLQAARAAEKELARLQPNWLARGMLLREPIPEGDKTREPRKMGLVDWLDLFLPRQTLVNTVVLDELLAAQERARAALDAEQAEAVAVYLSLMLGKVVDYNSVNTFWHTGSHAPMHTFSRHDFAFRPAFCEIEGAKEIFGFASGQVVSVYGELVDLVHGRGLEGDEDDSEDGEDEESDEEGAEALVEHAVSFRPAVLIPTITNNDAAALDTPAPGSVHLICVDPPYYGNVQYSELSNFFYVWLKRALHDWSGLEHLFREELAETNREAVANSARWRSEAEADWKAWEQRYASVLEELKDARNPATNRKWKKAEREQKAREQAGAEPPTAADRADKFYEDKMAAVFRRAKQLLHPAGRMVVMFNHKMTKAWRALGAALIREGFEIRTSIPIHTEAESSLNIRGLDAARSTVLLLCLPREESSQVTGNWGRVQTRVAEVARNAAVRFQGQGLSGTDLYLSALGPALGEVGRHWPITDMAGRPIDLAVALDEAYKAVGRFRLEQILAELTAQAAFADVGEDFSADSVDKNTQSLWLWLDTFSGDVADSDDVRKLAKSLDIEPDAFRKLKLLDVEGDVFTLKPPQAVSLGLLSRNLAGGEARSARDREAREADVWDERTFPGFLGAAVWNAIGLMAGGEENHRGLEALRQWLRNSGCAEDRSFRGAFAVTLHLLRRAFGKRRAQGPWQEATTQAGAAWDLAIKGGRR